MSPHLHDGFFDGIVLGERQTARLYFRTQTGERHSLDVVGLEAMNISNMREANIVLDLEVREPEEITMTDLRRVFEFSRVDTPAQEERALSSVRERRLKLLIVSSSYGAECCVLAEGWSMAQR